MRPTSYKKKWPCKHLGELIHFLESQHTEGLSIKAISEKTGLKIQYISSLFKNDDMKLSRAESIVESYGYSLKLFFPQKEWIFGGPLDINPKSKRKFPNAGNLGGLVKYINDSNKTINSLSKDMMISNNVLTSAFNNGDIFLSKLFMVIKTLDIEVFWSFEKKQS